MAAELQIHDFSRPSMRTFIPGRGSRAASFLLLLAATAALPTSLPAQVTGEARAANLAINGVLGALTASVRQAICGCLSWKGVAQGAAGGIAMGAGKQIAGSRVSASGVVGRQLHALGVSAIVSAGQEHPLLLVPLGPATLELRPGSGRPPRARLDVTDIVILGASALDREMRLDWASSLAAGAPVLLHSRETLPDGHRVHGFAFLGTVFVQERLDSGDRRRLVAHESIHVLQWDALRHLAAHPVERAVVRRIPRVRDAGAFLDAGLLGPGSIFLIASALPYHLHPWEREAYGMANGHPPVQAGGADVIRTVDARPDAYPGAASPSRISGLRP